MKTASDQTPRPVTVHVAEQDGVFTALYKPDPVCVHGPTELHFKLVTPGWAFADVVFGAPFSDLQMLGPTAFNLHDGGGPHKTSFKITLVQSALRQLGDPGPEQLDLYPEVLNGPGNQ